MAHVYQLAQKSIEKSDEQAWVSKEQSGIIKQKRRDRMKPKQKLINVLRLSAYSCHRGTANLHSSGWCIHFCFYKSTPEEKDDGAGRTFLPMSLSKKALILSPKLSSFFGLTSSAVLLADSVVASAVLLVVSTAASYISPCFLHHGEMPADKDGDVSLLFTASVAVCEAGCAVSDIFAHCYGRLGRGRLDESS